MKFYYTERRCWKAGRLVCHGLAGREEGRGGWKAGSTVHPSMTQLVIFTQSLIRLCGYKMSVGLVIRGLDVHAFIQRCRVTVLF